VRRPLTPASAAAAASSSAAASAEGAAARGVTAATAATAASAAAAAAAASAASARAPRADAPALLKDPCVSMLTHKDPASRCAGEGRAAFGRAVTATVTATATAPPRPPRRPASAPQRVVAVAAARGACGAYDTDDLDGGYGAGALAGGSVAH
jgi:hypothetical protein